MPRRKPIEYERRTVRTWLEALLDGSLALPRFQRSYVWTDRKISDLIMALLDGRPVGTMLLIDRYEQEVTLEAPQGERRYAERFTPRPISGAETDLAPCRELILDGQQRLTSLWRALELGTTPGLKDTEKHGRHAFLEVRDTKARDLEPKSVLWPNKRDAEKYIAQPARAAADDLIPLGLFHPRYDDSRMDVDEDALTGWCGSVTGDSMKRGTALWKRISQQLRAPLLDRNIWYAKLPRSMDRSDAIEIFVKVNESSAVIRKFDIAVAEYDRAGGPRSLRQEISGWAETNTHCENFFGTDEEKMIPKVGELVLKIACLQEGRIPTDKHFTAEGVLARLGDSDCLQSIFGGIEWTLNFLAQQRIWGSKLLPSAVPLRVLPALYPEFETIADGSDQEGVVRRCLRAYLWRAFVTDRYAAAANTRLKDDYDQLRRVLEGITLVDEPLRQCEKNVPVFKEPLPRRSALSSLDNPLAPPTRKDTLSRSLLVASLQHGARDFGSGEPVSEHNVRGRQAHHLFPKGYLKNAVKDTKAINHCLNYALVSGPTNRRISAKPPVDYLRDRYRGDSDLGEPELKRRVESHLIPFGALAVREQEPVVAYKAFLKERAKMLTKAVGTLARGEPL